MHIIVCKLNPLRSCSIDTSLEGAIPRLKEFDLLTIDYMLIVRMIVRMSSSRQTTFDDLSRQKSRIKN